MTAQLSSACDLVVGLHHGSTSDSSWAIRGMLFSLQEAASSKFPSDFMFMKVFMLCLTVLAMVISPNVPVVLITDEDGSTRWGLITTAKIRLF